MADQDPLSSSNEHHRVSVAQFDHAQKAVANGDLDYGIQLLMSCCKLEPGNLLFRRTLRQTQRSKFGNNMRGGALSFLTNSATKAKIMAARRSRDYTRILEYGEEILSRNPWDVGAQIDMADAADHLGLLDLSVWLLEQARQKDPNDLTLNRALARIYEKRGNFTQAMSLWEIIRRVDPTDDEAAQKGKDLAATDTIARGKWKTSDAEQEDSDLEPEEEVAPVDRTQQQIDQLKVKVEVDPTNPAVYLTLASFYRRHDRIDEARAVLEKGLGPTGNNFDVAVELAELAIEPFRRDLQATDRRLQERADDELRKTRIRLLKEINSRELDLFRQKADRYPTEKAHRYELGVRLLRSGQVDEAIRELQNIKADPRFQWKALLYLGHCFKARNNWRLAQRNFEDALQHLPASEDERRKEIIFELAQGFAESGDFARAVDLGNELANLDFTYRNIGQSLDQWEAKIKGSAKGATKPKT